ncbi:response regulator [Nocardioides sp. MAH-18]|uniref:Response regulator n=1 Tax=Nocardioides agri TaxID=2682843 RepID=A0A6L6XSH0_9ACTN|nr:response regulator transcription factor [Nocardioides sp. CGMCC 1.13656]MVQ50149.1 response regulator [Nocardioides sp. MAH-18]
MPVLRVLAVDDHPVYLRGLVATLEDAESIRLCGTAASAAEALEAITREQPDVVLLDLNLPDGNGVEVTRTLRARGYAGAIVMLTMYDDEVALRAALEAGARGYLLKGADQDEIVGAIRAAAHGGVVVGPQLADRLTGMLTGATSREPARLEGLSARETEILRLMAQGRTNPQIARELVLSPKTIRNHITNIFAKLGVSDREHALQRANELGLRERLGPSWSPDEGSAD